MQYSKKNPETIQKMFASIAENYDRANAVLSFNMHKYWNKQLVKRVKSHCPPSPTLLDLCSGTGDIGFGFIRAQANKCKVHFLDFCPEMLSFARAKSQKLENPLEHEIHFIQGDAQEIPLNDNFVDCITVAYGIRNVRDPKKCIEDSYRVLKKGGVFGILELTEPTNPVLRFGHRLYLKTVMPALGKAVATNKEAYEYLCSSIQSFVSPNKLMATLNECKFSEVRRFPLAGGAATILIGKK